MNLGSGRGFSAFELENGTNVAIIGSEIQDKVFPKVEPVGEFVTFLGRRFKVIGTLEKKGGSMGGGSDRRIIIPLETGRQIPTMGNNKLNFEIKTAITRPEEHFRGTYF